MAEHDEGSDENAESIDSLTPDGDTDVTLTNLNEEHVMALLQGQAYFQIEQLRHHQPKAAEVGAEVMFSLAEANPDVVREAFLSNREYIEIGHMPGAMLDVLDLEVEDGQVVRPDDDSEWESVSVE